MTPKDCFRLSRRLLVGLLHLALVFVLMLPEASAEEYRRFVLADGREYKGRIVSSTGLKLTIEVPQGLTTVDLGNVVDMQPIRKLDYDNQGSWRVLLAPVTAAAALDSEIGRLETAIDQLLDGIPALRAFFAAELSGRIGSNARALLDECAFESACVRPAADEGAVHFALVARLDTGATSKARTLSLFRVTVSDDSGEPPLMIVASWSGPIESNQAKSAILRALYAAFELHPDADRLAEFERVVAPDPNAAVAPPPLPNDVAVVPVVAKADGALEPPDRVGVPRASDARAPGAPSSLRLALVPIPGFPALVQGDLTGAILSWGVVVPATVVWVLWEGAASFHSMDHAILGLVGYYTATTAVNLSIGSGATNLLVSAAPLEDGWTAQISWRR